MNADIYKADLINRFTVGAGYTITESTRGSLFDISVVNGLTDKAERASRDAAVWAVRVNLVGGTDILAMITTTQRNSSTNVIAGQIIYNITTTAIETYDGNNWI